MQQQQQNIAKQRTSGRCNSKGRQGGRAKESASRARKRRLAPWSAPDTHGRLLFTIHDTIHFLPAFHLACQPCFLLSFHPSHPPSLPLSFLAGVVYCTPSIPPFLLPFSLGALYLVFGQEFCQVLLSRLFKNRQVAPGVS